MYQAGIEEQLVTEVTGHRSLSVRCYKKTGLDQKRKASQTLVCNPESPPEMLSSGSKD